MWSSAWLKQTTSWLRRLFICFFSFSSGTLSTHNQYLIDGSSIPNDSECQRSMKTSAVIDSTAESEEETEQEQIFASIHIHTAQWRLKTPPERFVDNVCHHDVVTSRSSTNKNHLKTKASLALACCCTCRHTCVTEDGVGDDLLEEVSPVEENWTELQWWHCQRFSIDSLGMMVYSGQILETKLCTKLNFSVLLFIVESLKAGVCFKLQKAINYNVYDHYLYIVSCILLFSYTYSSNNVFNSHY